ncbi:hypothetical protein H5410_023134 [Solanum commersonii]|uniref:Uncharacterized protein n=1 Tax=Solanum commersonii TaxID=4109 RepID=A0A9J5ZHF0_SOLCO|nr:hypothetical protein H5410_023134 [Solanum commersonii]
MEPPDSQGPRGLRGKLETPKGIGSPNNSVQEKISYASRLVTSSTTIPSAQEREKVMARQTTQRCSGSNLQSCGLLRNHGT